MKPSSLFLNAAATALLGLCLLPGAAQAQQFEVSVEIPRLNVAEYHRPYVAIWVARPDSSVALNLAVWYELKLADQEGNKWLKDLRQWWRRSGRTLEMPVDGLAGATRAAGSSHSVDFSPQLQQLAPGSYQLMVEAVREVGGREMLQIDFQWPPQQEQSLETQGKEELGHLRLRLSPAHQ